MNDISSDPAEPLSPQIITFDAIMPAEMAIRAGELAPCERQAAC